MYVHISYNMLACIHLCVYSYKSYVFILPNLTRATLTIALHKFCWFHKLGE